MNQNTFKKGDRVAENFAKFNPEEDDVAYGIVEAVSSNGDCLVKWDSKWRDTKYVPCSNLLSEDEALQKWSRLEAEFSVFEKQIQEKINQAVQTIHEAAELAKSQNYQLSELYDSVYPLKGALRKMGWNTSSLSC